MKKVENHSFKDSDYSLVSKKSLATNSSLGWRSGLGKLGQKHENLLQLWRHPQKNKIQHFIF